MGQSTKRTIKNMNSTITTRIATSTLVTVLLLSIASCGTKDEKKAASQVAAKVNSVEISVHQINFALGRSNTGALSAEQIPRLRRDILDKLIDQQLVVEKAIEKKIDRSPEVLMAIEVSRRDILARAYLEGIAAAQAKPTADEAKSYIAGHPALFAERRLYSLQEIVLPPSSKIAGDLRDMLSAGRTMEDIAAWLKSKDIKFMGGSATRPAEQIPLEFLPKLHKLKDGQSLVQENSQNITVVRLVNSQATPIDEATAMPRVQQYLTAQRAGEAAERELKQLKEIAKITYVGEFTGTEPTAAAAPVAKAEPTKPAAESATTLIEKGVAGLK